ncbi:MAG: hypothetical protein ACI9JL_000165 [Paracoccaceae bacterium]|jgi:hypothetical protein
MKVRNFGYLAVFTAAISLGMAGSAAAYNITIDQFYIQKNGNQYVDDTFSDNVAPPSSESVFGNGTAPVSYSTIGGWSESGGRANANSINGSNTTSLISGNPLTLSRARVNSNIDPNNLIIGLKNDDAFEVRGLFDLSSTLDEPGSYGIRIGDSLGLSNLGNDRSQLSVRRTTTGNFNVSFADIDLTAGTITNLDADTLQSGHDQILLVLTRATPSSGITASYAYVDGGSIDIGDSGALAGLTFETLNGVSTAFDGEAFTRTEFFASENPVQVNAPGMLAIFGLALAGLGVTRQRKWN